MSDKKFFDNLYKLYEQEMYTDVELCVGPKTYKLHKIMLSYPNSFFANILTGAFLESKIPSIKLHVIDNKCNFPIVIRYLYNQDFQSDITNTNCVIVLYLATYFKLTELANACHEFISKNEHRIKADEFLEQLPEVKLSPLPEEVIRVIAQDFKNHSDDYSQYYSISSRDMAALIQSPYIRIHKEVQMLSFVINYFDYLNDIGKVLNEEESENVINSIYWLAIPEPDYETVDYSKIISLDQKRAFVKNRGKLQASVMYDPIIKIALNYRSIPKLENILNRYDPAPVHMFKKDALQFPAECGIVLLESPPEKEFTYYTNRIRIGFSNAFLGHIYAFELNLSSIKNAVGVTLKFRQVNGKELNCTQEIANPTLHFSENVVYSNLLDSLIVEISGPKEVSAMIDSLIISGFYFNNPA